MAAAALVVALLNGPAYAASTNVLMLGSGGSVVVDDTLAASLASERASFSSGVGITDWWCKQAIIAATVTSNPPAPGTASASYVPQFGSCTGSTVRSVTFDGAPVVMKLSSGGQVTLNGAMQMQVVYAGSNAPCGYEASTIAGTAAGDGRSITFTDQEYLQSSGPATCPPSLRFSATYGPLVDSSQGGVPVVVN
jgi:hypothetical protein